MKTDEILKAASEINTVELESYLLNTGWQKVETGKSDIALFKKQSQKDLFEVLVPLSTRFADYKYRMADVIISIADAENKTIEDIAWILKSRNPAMSLKIQNKIDEIKKAAKLIPESFHPTTKNSAQSSDSLAKIITTQKMADDFLADLEMAIKRARAQYGQ